MSAFLVIAWTLGVGQLDAAALSDGYPRISRVWVDSTGEYRIAAKLISVTKEAVVLEREDKKTVTVPLTRLDQASREVAGDAYPHFVVEKKIHDIIEQIVEKAAEGNSPRDSFDLQKTLMAKANAELRKTKITMRYRIVEVTKRDKPRAATTKEDEYTVRFEHIHDWQVTPDSFQPHSRPAVAGYLRGWTLSAKEFDPAKVVANRSVFEMTGVPQVFHPAARDFSWRGFGTKTGADRRAVVSIMIGFAVLDHKIRVFTPGE